MRDRSQTIAWARKRLAPKQRPDPVVRLLRRLVWMALYGFGVAAAGLGVLRLLGDAPGVTMARDAATVLVVVSMVTLMVAAVGWSVYAWRRPTLAARRAAELEQLYARLDAGPDGRPTAGRQATCTLAYLAHLEGEVAGRELGDRVRTVLPDTPPAPCGFMIWGLPVAWEGPLFEITAASWAPARGEMTGRGVDVIAWAALTPAAVETVMRLAGEPNTPYARAQAYGSLGPLLPIDLVSLEYEQATDAEVAQWVGAVQATWAAMGSEDTLVRVWRPSWLDHLRGRGRFPSDGSPYPLVNCLRLRRGVRPPQLAEYLCR